METRLYWKYLGSVCQQSIVMIIKITPTHIAHSGYI